MSTPLMPTGSSGWWSRPPPRHPSRRRPSWTRRSGCGSAGRSASWPTSGMPDQRRPGSRNCASSPRSDGWRRGSRAATTNRRWWTSSAWSPPIRCVSASPGNWRWRCSAAPRTAEALRVLASFRQNLVDRTGLDPSGELVELEQRIAAGDQSLAVPGQRPLRGYVLGEVLGEGAFGTVYRATQPGLGREVALKVIAPSWPTTPRSCAGSRPRRSWSPASSTPTSCRCTTSGASPAAPTWCSACCGAATPTEALVRDGPWPLERVDRLVEEIGERRWRRPTPPAWCTATSSRQRVVRRGRQRLPGRLRHRPVDGRRRRGRHRCRAGSPLYASPEQVRDGRSTPRSDQYSLGGHGVGAAHRRGPVRGRRRLDACSPPSCTGLPSVRPRRPDVPEASTSCCATAGAADPTDRFASMADLLLAWRQAVGRSRRSRRPATHRRRPSRGAARQGGRTLVPSSWPRTNPYKGLRSFREADADRLLRPCRRSSTSSPTSSPATASSPSSARRGRARARWCTPDSCPRLRADDRSLVASMVPGAIPSTS